jgi:hypothetical protein
MLTFHSVNGQLGSWSFLSGKYSLSEKWSAFGEVQLRSTRFYSNYHYYEYKLGMTYSVDKNFAVSLAGGHYKTFSQGGDFLDPIVNNEFRLWQQVALTQHHARVKIEHLYRAEERWTSSGFRTRYRFRVNFLIPINKPKVEVGVFYLTASNEIFLIDRSTYFERNRVSALLGYQVQKHMSLQLGYLYQLDYKPDNETGVRFLQVGVQFDFKRHSQQERVPGLHD